MFIHQRPGLFSFKESLSRNKKKNLLNQKLKKRMYVDCMNLEKGVNLISTEGLRALGWPFEGQMSLRL